MSLIYKSVLRPVMLYGTECWAMRKKEDDLLRRMEMRMLRRILGVSLKDKIRNEEIRKRCGVIDIIEKVREARLRWYGHVGRKDAAEPVRSIMEMEIRGNRTRTTKEEMDGLYKQGLNCEEVDYGYGKR